MIGGPTAAACLPGVQRECITCDSGAGWSIYTEIKLVRDPTLPNHQTPYPTLGELLRQKAEEGVQVLLMVRRQGFRV